MTPSPQHYISLETDYLIKDNFTVTVTKQNRVKIRVLTTMG